MTTHTSHGKRLNELDRFKQRIKKWNKKHPVGTAVRYMPEQFPNGFETNRKTYLSKIRSPAIVIEKPLHALIKIDGTQFYIDLARVDVNVHRKATQR